jgi:DNA-binding MltR family transcriptional regulator
MEYNLFRNSLGARFLEKKGAIKLFSKEILSGSDRAAAVIGGSLLDGAIEDSIRIRLKTLSDVRGAEVDFLERALDNTFNPGRPLGSFSARRRMAYLMGIIGKTTCREIETITDIRNAFSHWHLANEHSDPASLSFKTRQIMDWCKTLSSCDRLEVQIGKTLQRCAIPKRKYRLRFAFSILVLVDELVEDCVAFENGDEPNPDALP